MKKILAINFLLFSTVAYAGPPILVDPQSGKYLGNLNANPYDQNSVSNPFGEFGSPYSQDSINNPVGVYGSPYSNKSINNPYATEAPIVVDPDGYDY
jgi:hypothetical protein